MLGCLLYKKWIQTQEGKKQLDTSDMSKHEIEIVI